MAAAPSPPARAHRDHNVVAMLSLYLLLLAFFILLNALSKLETDRARVVIESVNEAFDGQVEAPLSIEPHSAALGSLTASEDVLQSLQTLFSSMIPVVEAEAVVEAPLLRLDLSADALFRAGSTQLQPGRDLLMERIAQALSDAEQRGLYPQVELFHGMKQSSDATPETRSLAVRRLGALVRGFVERGRPAADLSIGVLADAGPRVRLLFRFYKEPPEPIDLGEVRE